MSETRAPKPPCGKGCPRRGPGCHDPERCPEWGAYLLAREAWNRLFSQARRESLDVELSHWGKEWK